MKKLLLLSVFLTCSYLLALSQTKLQYSVHALHAGIDNPMSYCTYADPGLAGEKQIWDFSKLEFIKPFTGYITDCDLSDIHSSFPKANTVLTEFDSKFILNVDKNKIEQYGYVSPDNKTIITYSTPFLKMLYPFEYRDIYSGTLSGNYIFDNKIEGDITGDYTIEADAYGTLVLPGNSVFNDVLRVKTIKNYTTKTDNYIQTVSIETIRWYNAIHPFPLLVLTNYTTTTNGNSSVNYQAAYNADALKSAEPISENLSSDDINLFPNPTASKLHLTFNAPITGIASFILYDASGKQMKAFQKEVFAEGIQEMDLTDEITSLKPGSYIMSLIYNGATLNKGFTITSY